MVALTNNSATLSPTPLRVRAQNHRCGLGALRCSKSHTQASLREATYAECNRLESCSKDPIGYAGGLSSYTLSASALDAIDPFGLCPTLNSVWGFLYGGMDIDLPGWPYGDLALSFESMGKGSCLDFSARVALRKNMVAELLIAVFKMPPVFALVLEEILQRQGTYGDVRFGGNAEGTVCRKGCNLCLDEFKLCVRGDVVGSATFRALTFMSVGVFLGYRINAYAQGCISLVDGFGSFDTGISGGLSVFTLGGSFISKRLLAYIASKLGIKPGFTSINLRQSWPGQYTGFAPFRKGAFGLPRCRLGAGAGGTS
jgi:hypothetical protein